MKKKFLFITIIFFSFGYGIVVGKFEHFPYKIIQSKYLFLKKKLILINNSNNFSRNEHCVKELNRQIQTKKDSNYRIFIAGHTYGSHNDNNLGIYPKFYNILQLGEKILILVYLLVILQEMEMNKVGIFLINKYLN